MVIEGHANVLKRNESYNFQKRLVQRNIITTTFVLKGFNSGHKAIRSFVVITNIVDVGVRAVIARGDK